MTEEPATDTASSAEAPPPAPDPEAQQAEPGPGRRVWIMIAAALAVGGFAVGYLVADDADDVSSLEDQLAASQDELSDTESELSSAEFRAAGLEDELASSEAKRRELASQLRAQLDFSGELDQQQTGSGPDTDFALGQPGEVGPYIFVLTGFEQTEDSGGQAVWVATMSAKNNGSEPTDPFCGSDGAAVRDLAGSRYTGDTVLAGTPNCGDSIQPGLTVDGYQMRFKMPSSAEPAAVEVWGDFFVVDEEDAKTWAVE